MFNSLMCRNINGVDDKYTGLSVGNLLHCLALIAFAFAMRFIHTKREFNARMSRHYFVSVPREIQLQRRESRYSR